MDAAFDESWFHVPLDAVGEAARLEDAEAFHLRKVLRVRPGQRIVATNGRGRVFLCDTADADGASGGVEARAVETLVDSPRPPRLHLALCLLKGKDTEDPVEGLCQLPLAAIHLVTSERTQDFKGQDHSRLVERLRQKSLVALKQAKKPWLTDIHPPRPLAAWRREHPGPLILVHPGPDRLDEARSGDVYVLVGPEGGFSAAEVAWLTGPERCMTLGLGATRLRATHAPLFACGKLMGAGLFPAD